MTNGIKDTRAIKNLMGQQLQKARKRQKLSRNQLAERLNSFEDRPVVNERRENMNLDRLKQWEYGNNPISVEWIPFICRALDCDVGYLFGEYEEMHREFSDVCAVTGLSEQAAKNLWHLKSKSQLENFFILEGVCCKAFSEEETPAWIINLLVEDEKILHLLYLFFVAEDMDGGGNVVKNTRSNAILIELIGILTNKRNCLEKVLQKGRGNNG